MYLYWVREKYGTVLVTLLLKFYEEIFFTKAVGYQRRNVLNMFSITMIIIYEEYGNLCVSFFK